MTEFLWGTVALGSSSSTEGAVTALHLPSGTQPGIRQPRVRCEACCVRSRRTLGSGALAFLICAARPSSSACSRGPRASGGVSVADVMRGADSTSTSAAMPWKQEADPSELIVLLGRAVSPMLAVTQTQRQAPGRCLAAEPCMAWCLISQPSESWAVKSHC